MLSKTEWRKYPSRDNEKGEWHLILSDMLTEISLGYIKHTPEGYRVVARHRTNNGRSIAIENIIVTIIKKLEKGKAALMEFWRLQFANQPSMAKYS